MRAGERSCLHLTLYAFLICDFLIEIILFNFCLHKLYMDSVTNSEFNCILRHFFLVYSIRKNQIIFLKV